MDLFFFFTREYHFIFGSKDQLKHVSAFIMCVFCLHVCVHVYAWYPGWPEEAIDLMALEWQTFVSCCMGTGNRTRSSVRAVRARSH